MRRPIIASARQRKWVVRGSILFLLGTAVAVGYCWHSSPRGPSAGPGPLLQPAAVTLAPGIHLLGGLDPAAAYAVETDEGLVLIDVGNQPDARLLEEQLGHLGLDWRRVRAILLTHIHADHTAGAEHLRVATGAKVHAGQGDAALLKAGKPHEAFFGSFTATRWQRPVAQPVNVDVELKGGEVLELGGARFRVIAAPGHTPGSICYLMERKGLRVLFAGDVIMSLVGQPRSHRQAGKPLGTYAAYMPPRYRGDAASFLTTLRKLRALPVPDLVLPGHPRMDPAPQSPVLSQERWEELLDSGIGEMETLLARYRRDGALFLDGTPKQLLPDLYYLGNVEGLAVYGFFAASRFFLVDAPGGVDLLDFCRKQLGKLGVKAAVPAVCLLTSCEREATAGLPDLVEKTAAQVVTSSAGVVHVQEMCPAGTVVLTADDLARKGWFDVQPRPLRGRGQAAIAYEVSWAGKTVLFSGRIPILLGVDFAQRQERGPIHFQAMTHRGLLNALVEVRANRMAYAATLRQLGRVSPNLWLPARPVDDQNANVYDREWQDILAANFRLLD